MANNKHALDEGFEEVPVSLDEGFEEVAIPQTPPRQSLLDRGINYASDVANSYLQNSGNSALFGLAPEINAAIEPLVDKITGQSAEQEALNQKLGLHEVKKPSTYLDRRESFKKQLQDVSDAAPIAALLGGVSGAVAPGAAIQKGVVKALPALGKMAIGLPAVTGAIEAGLTNPGSQAGEADPVQLEERLRAAGIGGLAGFGGGAIAKYLPSLASKLMGSAKASAFKALGPYSRDVIKANEKDAIGKIGQTLLDEGVISAKPKSYEELAKVLGSKKELAGQDIGEFIKGLEARSLSQAAETGAAMPGLNRQAMAEALSKDLVVPSKEAIFTNKNEKFKDLIQQFASTDAPIGLSEAQALKKTLGSQINWDRLPGADIPDEEKFLRSLYNKVSTGIEDTAETMAGAEGAKDAYKAMKQKYGNLSTAEQIASRKESKDFANRFISPSDYAAGGIGAIIGSSQGNDLESKIKGAAVGAGLGAVNKFGRTKGPQVSAFAKQGLSKLISRSEPLRQAYQQNPGAVQAAFNRAFGIGGGVVGSKEAMDNGQTTAVTDTFIDQNEAAKQFQNR